MDLERLQNLGDGMSVEEHIRMAVRRMKPDARLDMVMQVVGMGLDAEERLHDVVAEAWELVVKEEWWRARYTTFEEFNAQSGLADGVAEVMRRREQTKTMKRKFSALAAKLWGGEDLGRILGPELMPQEASKRFLEVMKVLARRLGDSDEAIKRLRAARDERLRRRERGRTRDVKLQVRDVEAVLRELGNKQNKGEMTITYSEEVMEVESEEDDDVELQEWAEGKNKDCGCRDVEVTKGFVEAIHALPCKDLKGRVEAMGGMDGVEWRGICHRHVRGIASSWELQTSRLKRDELIERVMEVQANVDRLDELTTDEETHLWFRKNGRPGREDDDLGPFKYARLGCEEFTFDRRVVWERFGGAGAMDVFLKDGNVVVKGLLDWIVKDDELMGLVDAEFGMYRYHLREQNGVSNLGWCRNMWHSLVQQVVRQDVGLYGLNVAARADKRWRLVSLPYYTKVFECQGFKHIDMNIPEFLKSGRFGCVVQSAVSMDDEETDGCTIVVPGFQNHIEEWWSEVVGRGEVKDGLTHSVEKTYRQSDVDRYGGFVPVVCKRGEVRVTMSQIIHGSTGGCGRGRRVVFPWLVGAESDGRKLEVAEWGDWEEISRAHRDLTAMKVSPSGQCHRFFFG